MLLASKPPPRAKSLLRKGAPPSAVAVDSNHGEMMGENATHSAVGSRCSEQEHAVDSVRRPWADTAAASVLCSAKSHEPSITSCRNPQHALRTDNGINTLRSAFFTSEQGEMHGAGAFSNFFVTRAQ